MMEIVLIGELQDIVARASSLFKDSPVLPIPLQLQQHCIYGGEPTYSLGYPAILQCLQSILKLKSHLK